MARLSVPRWSVYVVVAALIASLSFSFGSLYSAFGTSHDTTYYACLYAGSLSQVGTTAPVNCGRGEQISWSSEGEPGPAGPSGTSQAYTVSAALNATVEAESYATVVQFELPAGSYVVIATAQIFNPDAGSNVECRLVSGAQISSEFETDSSVSDILTMQGSFVLDVPADIELQCQTDSVVGGQLVTSVDFLAVQVDTITEIMIAQ